MPDVSTHIDEVGRVASALADLGLAPVLVGGMAGLRIDLLFDFPLRAAVLAKRAVRTKVRAHVLRVASEADLLRLKRIAIEQRSSPGDSEDVAFLESRRARRK